MLRKLSPFSSEEPAWSGLFLLTFTASIVYTFSEWLFIITKPSSIAILPLLQKVRIFLLSLGVVSTIGFALLAFIGLLWLILKWRWLKPIATLLPAGILSGTTLLLVDNFTYTLFHWGIATSSGWTRAMYMLAFLGMLYGWTRKVNAWLISEEKRRHNHYFRFAPIALTGLVILLLALTYVPPHAVRPLNANPDAPTTKKLPHILLITADGLNANHLSVYGYQRDTTPNLRQLAERSLVAENAYSNCAYTAGSVVSILTGKYPTTTRVIYRPDKLRDKDAFEHLPYILKSYGYFGVQYSWPHHVDAYALNFQSGFDIANGVIFAQSPVLTNLQKYLDEDSADYMYEILNRIVDRLRHIFFLKDMTDYRLLVPTNPEVFSLEDRDKLEKAIEILITSDKPVFAHIHWMGTHGPKFHPGTQIFSQGKNINDQEAWDPDFYDDAILEFDQAMGRLLDTLETHGLADQTVLIVASDHGQQWKATTRLPWIIHFPQDAYRRRIQDEVQSLDIAPTLLDYLGIPQPMWMEGASVLRVDPGPRPIFSTGIGDEVKVDSKTRQLIPETIKPPFYNIDYISVVSCNWWYRLKLNSRVWESGQIEDSTATCTPLPPEQVFTLIVEHLKERGFDTSGLGSFDDIQHP
ncbi:hypothetical protein SE15_06900 [Thermanaerothrix daxensis]|uniref:Sulfatase N-terminal domain-containing protein n=1 Tax=Thermanaerothrix daxensis TaxID=869279 RepID=A0A0P6Y2H8_9CHLR|nr:sulfatase-like hydrolase/transferase [Thermanaerothrix daxensis]KPL83401.1 hypothetical protein SE15_06900 [Thermanaerothrix daxensis]